MPDLRELLDREARTVRPGPEPFDRMLRLAGRRRRTRRVGSAVAALVVAGAGFLGAWAVLRPGGPAPAETPTPSETTTPSPAPSPTPTGPLAPGALPDAIVAVVREDSPDPAGRVELLDPETGEVLEVLLEVGFAEGTPDVAVAPDGRTIYVAQPTSACEDELLAIPFPDGPPEVIAAYGRSPAISPDGRLLAVSRDLECDSVEQLVVIDLETGEERVWTNPQEPDQGPPAIFSIFGDLAWSPDGRQLAFTLYVEDAHEVRVLDVSRGGSIDDAVRLQPDDADLWRTGGFLADGRLLVLETCCGANLGVDSRLVAVDPSTGAASGTLYDLGQSDLVGVDLDVTGTHVLFGRYDEDERIHLWRWAVGDDAGPTELGPIEAYRFDW